MKATITCCYCEKPASNRYREVQGWEELRTAGGANKIIGRHETGRYACDRCIRDIENKRTPGSPSMF